MFGLLAGCVVLAGCGGGSNGKAAVTASAAPTISSVLGLPVGAIDRARILAACTDIRQADTLLSGGMSADEIKAQLAGAAAALGSPAGLAAHPDIVQMVAAWRAAVTAGAQRNAIAGALGWCAQNHG